MVRKSRISFIPKWVILVPCGLIIVPVERESLHEELNRITKKIIPECVGNNAAKIPHFT